jgi:hypothetical protein
MRKQFILVGLAALVLGCWLGWQAATFLAIDSCLDAGGMWKEQGAYCYGARASG